MSLLIYRTDLPFRAGITSPVVCMHRDKTDAWEGSIIAGNLRESSICTMSQVAAGNWVKYLSKKITCGLYARVIRYKFYAVSRYIR